MAFACEQARGLIEPDLTRSRQERFWIITDAGHAVTTVLMPEDY